MEITIHSKYVVIKLIGFGEYRMTYTALADFEKAIEIIRNLQNAASIEAATIKTA